MPGQWKPIYYYMVRLGLFSGKNYVIDYEILFITISWMAERSF